MKIFIDIGHPAHVHYFRNFIKIMEMKGHQFFISARDKEVIHELLINYNIQFYSRGKGSLNLGGKVLYLLKANVLLYNFAKKFNPDIFLSFGSGYAAHVAMLLRKPHLAFDDTPHAIFEHILYVPFTECIITPSSFKKSFGNKQIFFNGTMDNSYLHPKYFVPDIEYLIKIGLKNKKYFLVRFINWTASHDIGSDKLSENNKFMIIDLLEKHGEVVISSEGDLPSDLERFRYKGDPTKIHTLLYNAQMFVGESATMATESSVLGTPSILINSIVKEGDGIINYLSDYGNLFHYRNYEEGFRKIENLLELNNLKNTCIKNTSNYFSETINLTDFMVWFVENYPKSFQIVKQDKVYIENNFRT